MRGLFSRTALHGLALFIVCAAATANATPTIEIQNYAFVPNTLTVAVGTEVTWVNQDNDPHTVKSDPAADVLKSPALDTNDKYSFTFTKPGVYKYFCTLHPHMQGEIVVK
jgi:plastocyanin